MSDPFVVFMDTYVPTYGLTEAFERWLLKQEMEGTGPYVIPDLESFTDTSGTFISGRKAWREHLARSGAEELSRSDLQGLAERQAARVSNQRERVRKLEKEAKISHPQKLIEPAESSQTARRVLERLHGRPTPDRKTLIQIAIEERKRK